MARRHTPPEIDLAHFERPSTYCVLDAISQQLIRELSSSHTDVSSITSKDLSVFLGSLMKFQNQHLGIGVSQKLSRYPVKIPIKLLKIEPAPTPTSPVYHVLAAAYKYKAIHEIRRWDWQRIDKIAEVITYIRQELIRRGVLKNPIIMLADNINVDKKADLVGIISRMGGRVTNSIDEATHIVHSYTTTDTEEADDEWFRTLEKRNGQVFVHWWYYPDSYDQWIPETDDQADPEPAPDHTGPWNISARWLRDSEAFNEWMNEEDYEIDGNDRRLSAGEDQTAATTTTTTFLDTGSLYKRSHDSYADQTTSEMDVDIQTGNPVVKRARKKSPEPDAVPTHKSIKLVNIEESAPKVGVRGRKNEFEPIPGGDISNISQEIPGNISKLSQEKQDNDNSEVDNLVNNLNEAHLAPDNNANVMDIDHSELDQADLTTSGLTPQNSTSAISKESEDPDSAAEPTSDSKAMDDSGAASTPQPDSANTESSMANAEAEKRRLEEEARKYLSQQTQEVIIPSYAAWFDMARIHEIEKRSLPEFFNSKNKSKTPSVYKEYRDFIINTYRLNPSEYLTVTACRRNLAGDVCAIIRVHAFLEQWGLINYQVFQQQFLSFRLEFIIHFFLSLSCYFYSRNFILNIANQIDPETRPSTIGPAFTGHFRVSADTPRGLQPFQPVIPSMVGSSSQQAAVPGPSSVSRLVPNPAAMPLPTKVDLNLGLRENIYSTVETPSETRPSEKAPAGTGAVEGAKHYNCFTCGVDCTRVRYHNLKSKNFELCPNCYLDGRFPSDMFSGDFVKMDEAVFKHAQDEEWSEQETLLLLEGVEMHDDDWNKIADHVGTRTREQCILHFLQLPIEEPYLGTSMADLGALNYQRIPFSQADNPIMSVVAFLASVVNPGVAAAAAQSSLKELAAALKRDKDKRETNGINGSDNQENAMDVDQPSTSTADVDPSSQEASSDSQSTIARSTLEKAGAAALGSAAAKAKQLADYEEREIQRLVNTVIDAQLRKLELKLSQFEELEALLDAERKEIEKQRQQLFNDRLLLRKNVLQIQDQLKHSGINPAVGHSYASSSGARIISSVEYAAAQQAASSIQDASMPYGNVPGTSGSVGGDNLQL
ncbi:6289_t:CDS:2 [Paraglomus brasilianum]|uniref:6289_t:CDS:1 n=1 Tax=Paraglomus brasilianum TaxID=144538 RepID=A0A9N9GCN7_9GLOM|nr:6289_t:CDS:2 [Paraglomus brasilianum]